MDYIGYKIQQLTRGIEFRTFLLALACVFVSTSSSARELKGRFGLGYNAEFANNYASGAVPAISIKYGITREIGTELIVGINTATPTNSVTGIKFFKNIFFETNLNFYSFLGAGLLRASNLTGAQFLGGFGSEFFIPGIESLGFSMDVGGAMDNLSGSFALKTLGVSFLNAGIHFYF
ncbi:MAG: hypothetical protein AABZ55_11190 [Bdellovibrionota bacterium]